MLEVLVCGVGWVAIFVVDKKNNATALIPNIFYVAVIVVVAFSALL